MDALDHSQFRLFRSRQELFGSDLVDDSDGFGPAVDRALAQIGNWRVTNAIESLDDWCEEVAAMMHRELDLSGLNAKVLEGEIRQSEHDYLTHRAVLVRRTDSWLYVDAAASQFDEFADSDIVTIETAPTAAGMLKALRSVLRWV